MEKPGKIPFIRILLPFLTGIVAHFYLPPLLFIALIFLLVIWLALVLFYLFKDNHFLPNQMILWSLLAQFFLFILGYSNAFMQDESQFLNLRFSDGKNYTYLLKVDENPVEKKKSIRMKARVLKIINSDTLHFEPFQILWYAQKSSLTQSLVQNDVLLVNSSINPISPPENPHQFDQRKFYKLKNIFYTAFSDSNSIQVLSKNESGGTFFSILRGRLKKVLQQHIDDENDRAIVSALVLGDKTELDDEVKQNFSYSGTMHILAVSGLHVAAIYLLFEKLLFFLDKKRYLRMLKILLLLVALWFYAFLADLSPSVIRASLMFSIVGVGKLFDSKSNIYNSIFASAFLILLFAPFQLFEVGFILSYSAVLGIVIFQPMIYNWLSIKNRWIDKIWNLSSVTLAAQLSTTPVSLFYFGTFPNYFFLSNLFAVPLSSFILYSGVLSIFTFGIPFAGALMGNVLAFLVHMLNFITRFFSSLPYAVSIGNYISFEELIIVYFLIAVVSLFLITRKIIHLKITLIGMILWVVFQVFQSIQQIRVQQITVYSIPGAHYFEVNAGGKVYSDFSEKLTKDQFNYSVKPNHSALGIKEVTNLNEGFHSGFYWKQNCLIWNGKLLLVAADEKWYKKHHKKLNADYVLLKNIHRKINQNFKDNFFNSATVIIGKDFSKYSADKIEKDLQESGFKVINLYKTGACLINF